MKNQLDGISCVIVLIMLVQGGKDIKVLLNYWTVDWGLHWFLEGFLQYLVAFYLKFLGFSDAEPMRAVEMDFCTFQLATLDPMV